MLTEAVALVVVCSPPQGEENPPHAVTGTVAAEPGRAAALGSYSTSAPGAAGAVLVAAMPGLAAELAGLLADMPAGLDAPGEAAARAPGKAGGGAGLLVRPGAAPTTGPVRVPLVVPGAPPTWAKAPETVRKAEQLN